MSQNPYVDCQKLLQEMVSRYEEMFAEFEAMRQIFREEMVKELPLMTRYEQALSGLRDLSLRLRSSKRRISAAIGGQSSFRFNFQSSARTESKVAIMRNLREI
jgi:hypothetical protein